MSKEPEVLTTTALREKLTKLGAELNKTVAQLVAQETGVTKLGQKDSVPLKALYLTKREAICLTRLVEKVPASVLQLNEIDLSAEMALKVKNDLLAKLYGAYAIEPGSKKRQKGFRYEDFQDFNPDDPVAILQDKLLKALEALGDEKRENKSLRERLASKPEKTLRQILDGLSPVVRPNPS